MEDPHPVVGPVRTEEYMTLFSSQDMKKDDVYICNTGFFMCFKEAAHQRHVTEPRAKPLREGGAS